METDDFIETYFKVREKMRNGEVMLSAAEELMLDFIEDWDDIYGDDKIWIHLFSNVNVVASIIVVKNKELWKLIKCTKCDSSNIINVDDVFDFTEVIGEDENE